MPWILIFIVRHWFLGNNSLTDSNKNELLLGTTRFSISLNTDLFKIKSKQLERDFKKLSKDLNANILACAGASKFRKSG
jgi:hypothetical protein